MDKFKADLRQVDRVDVQSLGVSLPSAAPRRALPPLERQALKGALSFSKNFDPRAGLFLETIGVGERPPAVSVLPPASMGVGLSSTSKGDLTVALGVSASASLVFTALGGGGVYGSTTREIGVYFTAGGGLFSNIGMGIGPELTIIFGTPADFSGVYIGVTASVAAGAGALGGTLLFSPVGATGMVFMGFSVSFAIGPSFLPVSMGVEVTDTALLPLITF